MGSFFAGIKAGTLSGVLYVGVMALFNVSMLYAFQPQVLTAIQTLYPAQCPATPINGTSSADCFASLVAVDVPFNAFVAFFVALLYAGVMGIYYDLLPGKSPTLKGVAFASVISLSLVFFGLSGYVFDLQAAIATGIFLLSWTPVFGYVLGRLYRKYTRTVSIGSLDPGMLKVMVDGRDLTGKTRTFAHTSSHKVRAEVAEDASFKEWEATGGVTVEDPRSFETVLEVNGEGTLTGKVGKKY